MSLYTVFFCVLGLGLRYDCLQGTQPCITSGTSEVGHTTGHSPEEVCKQQQEDGALDQQHCW